MKFGKCPVVAQRSPSHQVSEMIAANRRRRPSSSHRFVPEADYRAGNERRLASDHHGEGSGSIIQTDGRDIGTPVAGTEARKSHRPS